LTLVLPKAGQIPPEITAGGPTVGIRWPSHPLIQAVIRECGFPLAAPSANPSNSISPTHAEHVRKSLGNRIPLIVDGGQCQVGIESTVLDLSVSPLKVLRPGMIHQESLQAVTGELAAATETGQGMLKSPGLLAKHYSPKAKVLILAWNDEEQLTRQLARQRLSPVRCHVISHTHVPSGKGLGRVAVIPHDAEAFGRAIYSELHECDNQGAEWIVIEALPETSEWQAIADRLNRAAGPQAPE
jgi:L-threonylcarbamoyladenylate synthase